LTGFSSSLRQSIPPSSNVICAEVSFITPPLTGGQVNFVSVRARGVISGVGDHAPPQNAAALVATGLIVMVEFAHFNRDEEEYPMTDASLLIEELAAKSGDGDFLRSESVMQLIMEADVDGLIGAGRHERSGERATWRNTATVRWIPGSAQSQDPQAADRDLLPGLPRTQEDGRKGAGGGNPGSVDRRGQHPPGR
jgi:hypothetical protein